MNDPREKADLENGGVNEASNEENTVDVNEQTEFGEGENKEGSDEAIQDPVSGDLEGE